MSCIIMCDAPFVAFGLTNFSVAFTIILINLDVI